MDNQHRNNLIEIIEAFVKIPYVKNDVGSLEPHPTETLESLVVRQVIPVTIDIFNIDMSNNKTCIGEIMDVINCIKKDEFSRNHLENYLNYIGKEIEASKKEEEQKETSLISDKSKEFIDNLE